MSDYPPTQAWADAQAARRSMTLPRPEPRILIWVGALGLAAFCAAVVANVPTLWHTAALVLMVGPSFLTGRRKGVRRSWKVGDSDAGPPMGASDWVGMLISIALGFYAIEGTWHGRPATSHLIAAGLLLPVLGLSGEYRRTRVTAYAEAERRRTWVPPRVLPADAADPRFEERLQQPLSLRICAMLSVVGSMESSAIRDELGVSTGELDHQLTALTDIGYVTAEVAHTPLGVSSRRWFRLSPSGRAVLASHLVALAKLIQAGDTDDGATE